VPLDPATPAQLYAACGYLALGNRALRVDRLEHLAATVQRAARDRAFRPSREMAAIVGCTVEELAPPTVAEPGQDQRVARVRIVLEAVHRR
jgi:hypothetical protein